MYPHEVTTVSELRPLQFHLLSRIKLQILLKSKGDESQNRQDGWIGILQTAAWNWEGWAEKERNDDDDDDSDEDDNNDDDAKIIYS